LKDLWGRRFAGWAPDAIAAARAYAGSVADRVGAEAEAAYRDRLARDAEVKRAWLARTAQELSGVPSAVAGDLFASEPAVTDWRTLANPRQRLMGFAADPAVAMPQRRQAAEALAKATAQPPAFPQLVLRSVGMLMVVP
jgi:hypothetical protein